jgi:hypothetical protein
MMTKDFFATVAEGFTEVLRLYADLFLAPIRVLSAFVRHENRAKLPDDRPRST